MTKRDINNMIETIGTAEYSSGALPYLMQQQIIATLEVAFQTALLNEQLSKLRFTHGGELKVYGGANDA